MGVTFNEKEAVNLPPMGHTSTLRETALLAGMRVTRKEEGGAVVAGMAVRTERLARLLFRYATQTGSDTDGNEVDLSLTGHNSWSGTGC